MILVPSGGDQMPLSVDQPDRNGFLYSLSGNRMVFEDFVVPEPIVLVPLLMATVGVMAILYSVGPIINQRVALAVVPWIMIGALLHVIYQMHLAVGETLFPDIIAQLLSAPAVYLTTFVVAGLVLAIAVLFLPHPSRTKIVARRVGWTGLFVLAIVVGYAGWQAVVHFEIDPIWPVLGLVGSFIATAVIYILVGFWRPYAIGKAQVIGGLVLFSHLFDAITTAIGIEILDAAERSTAPQLLIELGADTEPAAYLGDVWLFVLVKIVLAIAIVLLFADYVDEHPTEGNLFFLAIAAVGLGPGTHNFFLFFFGVG